MRVCAAWEPLSDGRHLLVFDAGLSAVDVGCCIVHVAACDAHGIEQRRHQMRGVRTCGTRARQDTRVCAVVATWFFGAGMECVAGEFDTALLTQGDPMAVGDFYRRVGPNFFILAMSTDRRYRNWIHWANAEGLLARRRISIYSGRDAPSRHLVSTVTRGLAAFGQTPVVEVTTETPATGAPQDAVAVQRFRAAAADLALLMVSSISQTNFLQQADA